MGDKSPIEWTDSTWNPTTGCTKVSQGCKNCYAERLFPRVYGRQMMQDHYVELPNGGMPPRPREFTDVLCHPERLDQPLRWRKPRRIFVNSMSDLFHEDVPDEFIDDIFAVMALSPRHTFQVLTKRPERMREYLGDRRREAVYRRWQIWDCSIRNHLYEKSFLAWPLPNVWLGTSVEDQETADERIPLLLQTPAAIRFVSYEPALAPVDFSMHFGLDPNHDDLRGLLHWLIAGGESGPNARPAHPDWFRSVRDQCAAAGVAFFFKQWGEYGPCGLHPAGTATLSVVCSDGTHLEGLEVIASPEDGSAEIIGKFGKKRAGHMLDGREHSEYPA
jgi:protein gp37